MADDLAFSHPYAIDDTCSKHPWLLVVSEDICEWKIRCPIAVEHLPKKTLEHFPSFFPLLLLLLILFFPIFFLLFLCISRRFLTLITLKKMEACMRRKISKDYSVFSFFLSKRMWRWRMRREKKKERNEKVTSERGPEILETHFTGNVNDFFSFFAWIMYISSTSISYFRSFFFLLWGFDLPVSSTNELANSKIV